MKKNRENIAHQSVNFWLLISLLTLTTIIFASRSFAKTEAVFRENGNYKRISAKGQTGEEKGKIIVTEFFLYSCPPCYQLDPKLTQWMASNQNDFILKRVPAVVSSSWVPLAKAYYVAEKLGILDKSHQALFDAIHKKKNVYLNEYSLSQFYSQFGIDKYQFINLYNSKEIVDKVSQARILSVAYQLRGVPTVIINNEFKTAPFYNRDQSQMLAVMDYLRDKILARKEGKKYEESK